MIGPAASTSPAYTGGGSAYVLPSATVSPLQGIKSAAGSGTTVSYTQGLPTDTALPAIPASALSPAYAPTPFGGSYTGTLTAPQTGTYVLAVTNPCGCYTPTYLKLNGRALLDVPSTPPVHTYSVAVHLQAGHSYRLLISGDSSALTWGTPSHLAPGIAKAVAAAKSAATAVVVVSDDTETEAADRFSLNLPSAQDELVSAVAAANPRTVVVINAGAPVAMPWLNRVAGVVDAWYPGQTSGTALAGVLFGKVNPSGHLPVTFPVSLSQVPAAAKDRFPGVNGKVHYSEGLDVGYRWYDAKGIQPLFPFGFGLSYTTFGYSGLTVTPAKVNGVSTVRVSATVTNTGSRTGTDVAQLYLGDPAGAGEPARQLAGFQRVTLGPGQFDPVDVQRDPPGHLVVGPAGRRLEPDGRRLPGVRRRLLRAGRPAAARVVPDDLDPGRPAGCRQRSGRDSRGPAGHRAGEADPVGQPDAARRPVLAAGAAGLAGSSGRLPRVRRGHAAPGTGRQVHRPAAVVGPGGQLGALRDRRPRRPGATAGRGHGARHPVISTGGTYGTQGPAGGPRQKPARR